MYKFALIVILACFAVNAMAIETTYFSGEEVMYSADGATVYETKPKLLKRTVDQNSSKIIEESVIITQGKPKIVNLELLVNENSYTVTTSGFSGKGDFWGVPWQWTAWTSEFDIPDGSKLKVVDYLTGDSLLATSEYFNPDGSLYVVMQANLKKVEAQTYESLKNAMLATENKIGN